MVTVTTTPAACGRGSGHRRGGSASRRARPRIPRLRRSRRRLLTRPFLLAPSTRSPRPARSSSSRPPLTRPLLHQLRRYLFPHGRSAGRTTFCFFLCFGAAVLSAVWQFSNTLVVLYIIIITIITQHPYRVTERRPASARAAVRHPLARARVWAAVQAELSPQEPRAPPCPSCLLSCEQRPRPRSQC